MEGKRWHRSGTRWRGRDGIGVGEGKKRGKGRDNMKVGQGQISKKEAYKEGRKRKWRRGEERREKI